MIRYLTPSKAFCRCGRLTADVARRNEINDYLIYLDITSIHSSHVFEHISVTFDQNTVLVPLCAGWSFWRKDGGET